MAELGPGFNLAKPKPNAGKRDRSPPGARRKASPPRATAPKAATPNRPLPVISRDPVFLRRAIALSLANAGGRGGGPFGAVVVKDGRIVGEGSNRVTPWRDPTAHAEVVAIRAAARRLKTHDLSGAVIYASCEPCPMCLTAILWARITRMVYACSRTDAAKAGFDDEWFYRQVALPVDRRAIKAVRMMAPEGRRAFRVWAANPIKVEY